MKENEALKRANNSKGVLLSSTVSLEKYLALESAQDRESIANFLKTRFSERYIWSLQTSSSHKSGFAIMAMACLMIESLQSFHAGWTNSKGKSREAFRDFFSSRSRFSDFAPLSDDFYEHIRCGLLHQAETTGGWRIRRTGSIWNAKSKTINANKFIDAVEEALGEYCNQLAVEPWDSAIWKNFRMKMQAVCENAAQLSR